MLYQLQVDNSAMKNLQGLLAFVETAAAGTLTAAAERLELTPAAVSKGVATLERQLGVRLFNRSTRRLALTPEGERFLADAGGALRLLDQAVAGVSRAAREPAGRVRISVGIAFGRRWVLPALPALTASHPALSIEVDLDNRPVDLVAEGYDIGIRGGVIEDSSLIARRVCRLPLALLASPAYLREAGVPTEPNDLATHRCAVVRLSGSASPWHFQRANGRRVELTPTPQLTTSDPEALIDLALAGAGIVQSGLQHALPHLRAGTLKLLLPGVHDAGAREIVLHYPHRKGLAPRVRVVLDALQAHLAQAADLHLTLPEITRLHPDWVAAAPGPPRPGRAASSTPAARVRRSGA